jgi:hypothetical protein
MEAVVGSEPAKRLRYQKPKLVKREMLSEITAACSVSNCGPVP